MYFDSSPFLNYEFGAGTDLLPDFQSNRSAAGLAKQG